MVVHARVFRVRVFVLHDIIEIADAVLLMRLVTEDDSLTLSPDSTNNADADEDTLFTLADVAALLNILNT